jgi:hypothetical protein
MIEVLEVVNGMPPSYRLPVLQEFSYCLFVLFCFVSFLFTLRKLDVVYDTITHNEYECKKRRGDGRKKER